jgi:hypothetical protein
VVAKHGFSERFAYLVSGQNRSTQRDSLTQPDVEAAITADIKLLATKCGHYGYRRISATLRQNG